MKKKREAPALVPRMGPATNIRQAGAHRSKKLYDRKKMKAIFRKSEDGLLVLETSSNPRRSVRAPS